MRDVEIERKYLLRGRPSGLEGARSVEIEQGYLPGERIRERLRRYLGEGEERYVRSIKAGRGVSRIEVEEEIGHELFAALWPLTAGRRLRKRRHYVADDALTWEVDEFLDRDLWLAELELPEESHEVAIPAWLAPSVVREVTDDPAYLNASLAR